MLNNSFVNATIGAIRDALNTVTPPALIKEVIIEVAPVVEPGYGITDYLIGAGAIAAAATTGIAYAKGYLPSNPFKRNATPAFVAPTLEEVRAAMKSDAVRAAFDGRHAETQEKIVAKLADKAAFDAFKAQNEAEQIKAVSRKSALKVD